MGTAETDHANHFAAPSKHQAVTQPINTAEGAKSRLRVIGAVIDSGDRLRHFEAIRLGKRKPVLRHILGVLRGIEFDLHGLNVGANNPARNRFVGGADINGKGLA